MEGLVIFILICIIAFYSHHHYQQKRELEEKNKELQEQKDKALEKEKTTALQRHDDCIALLKRLYNCDNITAENMYQILKDVSMVDSFLDADNNDKSRKDTFEFAKILKKNQVDFQNYYETVILPIIEKNSYKIGFEDIEWHKDTLRSRPEISLETKLFQLNLKRCFNIDVLFEALRSSYSSPEEVFFDHNFKRISENNIYLAAKCYNSYFREIYGKILYFIK